MDSIDIKLSLEKHALWIEGDDSGVRADLSWADLSGADLSGANLSRANLYKADLSWADLSWADLSGADLYKAGLSGAIGVYGFTLGGHFGFIAGDIIKIGCKTAPLDWWLSEAGKKFAQRENYTDDCIAVYRAVIAAIADHQNQVRKESLHTDRKTK